MAKATPQQRVLATAAKEIGYSRWNDKKQGTKYARETQPVFWPKDTWLLANGISYCDLFITWVFWKALGKAFVTSGALPAGASYNTDYRTSKGGRIKKSQARPGDVLVFDWNWSTAATNHVGILEKVLPSGNYQTIEGNTSVGSSGSQSNGGRVARRTRRPGQVRYVIRPVWSKAGQGAPVAVSKNVWETSPRIQGMSKAEVKRIQQMLVDANNSIGKSGVDGSYGKDTFNTVKRVQKALGLTADGVFGPATEKALAAHLEAMGKKVPAKPAKPKAPAFPLPRKTGALYYYGLASGPKTSVSGQTRNTAVPGDVVQVKSRWMSKGLALFQAQLIKRGWSELKKDGPDGRFGKTTEKVVRQFQTVAGLKVDGQVGPATWAAAWETPVK
ncbi:peptidoglycan-binding protein [Brachybacterium alimentarium]|uniref:peptidoglycan-binding protein n=1 Tax=Brachybacterium alimentarium TaxID=47845 RepID=UPI003FD0FF9F